MLSQVEREELSPGTGPEGATPTQLRIGLFQEAVIETHPVAPAGQFSLLTQA